MHSSLGSVVKIPETSFMCMAHAFGIIFSSLNLFEEKFQSYKVGAVRY